MKGLRWTLATLLWAWAAVGVSALPTLVADSAALDRSYIPALMLSNGKDPAKALAAEDRARDELPAALDAAGSARIDRTAPAIKPPFARAYAVFGVFPQ